MTRVEADDRVCFLSAVASKWTHVSLRTPPISCGGGGRRCMCPLARAHRYRWRGELLQAQVAGPWAWLRQAEAFQLGLLGCLRGSRPMIIQKQRLIKPTPTAHTRTRRALGKSQTTKKQVRNKPEPEGKELRYTTQIRPLPKA
jgi:hypothetical protein